LIVLGLLYRSENAPREVPDAKQAMLINWHNRHRIQQVCQPCCAAKRMLVALTSRTVRLGSLLNATCFASDIAAIALAVGPGGGKQSVSSIALPTIQRP